MGDGLAVAVLLWPVRENSARIRDRGALCRGSSVFWRNGLLQGFNGKVRFLMLPFFLLRGKITFTNQTHASLHNNAQRNQFTTDEKFPKFGAGLVDRESLRSHRQQPHVMILLEKVPAAGDEISPRYFE